MPYDPEQPRDDNGQWTDGGSSGGQTIPYRGGDMTTAIRNAASDKKEMDNSSAKKLIENDPRYNIRLNILKFSGAIGKYGLEDYETVALSNYTLSGYEDMNSYLAQGGEASDLTKAYIHATKTGLAKLPDYNGTVYRNTDMTTTQVKEYENALKNNTAVEHKYFTSATKNKDNSFPGNTTFVIQSKSGKSLSFLSKTGGKNEDEILFTAGTKFNVSQVIKDGDKTIIHLK